MFSQFKELRAQLIVEEALHPTENLPEDHPGRCVFRLKERTFLPRDGTEYKGVELEPCVGFFTLHSTAERGATLPKDVDVSISFGNTWIPWSTIEKCVIDHHLELEDGDQGAKYYRGNVAVKLWAVKEEDKIPALVEKSRGKWLIVDFFYDRYRVVEEEPPSIPVSGVPLEHGVVHYPLTSEQLEAYGGDHFSGVQMDVPGSGIYYNATWELLETMFNGQCLRHETEEDNSIHFGAPVSLLERYLEKVSQSGRWSVTLGEKKIKKSNLLGYLAECTTHDLISLLKEQ